jgi:hypothetical protein
MSPEAGPEVACAADAPVPAELRKLLLSVDTA